MKTKESVGQTELLALRGWCEFYLQQNAHKCSLVVHDFKKQNKCQPLGLSAGKGQRTDVIRPCPLGAIYAKAYSS